MVIAYRPIPSNSGPAATCWGVVERVLEPLQLAGSEIPAILIPVQRIVTAEAGMVEQPVNVDEVAFIVKPHICTGKPDEAVKPTDTDVALIGPASGSVAVKLMVGGETKTPERFAGANSLFVRLASPGRK